MPKKEKREDIINKYFDSIQTPESKVEKLNASNSESDNFKEKKSSIGYISLGKLSNKPLKQSSDNKNIASEIK